MKILFFALWVFLPAGIANMVPVFAAKVPLIRKWDSPLDFGLSFGGKRIFGDHKTIRGVVAGVIMGILVAYLQYYVILASPEYVKHIFLLFDYMKGNPFIFGFLLSFGALLGDAVKSFFKRRTNIRPGGTWFPFDQIDYILGGILGSLVFVKLSWTVYLVIFLIYFCLHILATTIGYFFGLKESVL